MIDPTIKAQAWSDAIINNGEALYYFLTTTTIGLCISIPVGLILYVCFLQSESRDALIARQRQENLERAKATAIADYNTAKRLEKEAAEYRSPSGYNRGVKLD